MAWQWRYEGLDGNPIEITDGPEQEAFPTQADAETWVGEIWQQLRERGVQAVSLWEDDRKAYGPMGLDPA